MPATITCRISRIDGTLQLPAMPLRLGGSTLETHFATGSGNDVNLRMVQSPALNMASGAVQMSDLHRGLLRLTGNPTNVTSVNTIGLILADSYAPRPTAFGFMFDRGFTFDSNQFGRVPREGCAVFIGAIARDRPTTFAEETAFTAVHELGHVFNLFHLEQFANFMASNPSSIAAAISNGFVTRHQRLLGLCSTQRFVHPGGSEFGDLGMLDVGPTDPFRDAVSSRAAPLRLSISMARPEFWHFEPVELDIVLSARRGVTSAIEVPDALDPGYEIFRIWIEDPSGERRLYRSAKYFCTPPGMIRVAPGVPFRRDLSIFGQAGGYTFARTGEHRIRAEFFVPGIGRLRSNEVVVNVLPVTARNRMVRNARPVLESREVARLLFYRTGSSRSKAFRKLEDLARSMRSSPVAADIHYALGRAVMKTLPKSQPDRVLSSALNHLSRAASHSDLSPHRREMAEKLITEIQSA